MPRKAVPMFHVPDVSATARWYQSIGFELRDEGSDGDDVIFAALTFGDSAIMLSAGGRPSAEHRREVDPYLFVEDIGAVFDRVSRLAKPVEGIHDTFYGMREFIVRDINGFWITLEA